MYGTQDQRLRSNAEREQLVELFSYAVGIFDFEPDPDLRKFVQVRGAVQLYGYFDSAIKEYGNYLEDGARKIYINRTQPSLEESLLKKFGLAYLNITGQ